MDGRCSMTPIKWTPERIAWFVKYVPGHSEREISAEHERLFGFPLTESQIGNAKTRFHVRSGTFGGRFEKGQGANRWFPFPMISTLSPNTMYP